MASTFFPCQRAARANTISTKIFREIPLFLYSARLNAEFLSRWDAQGGTFTCKRGRMKRGNTGVYGWRAIRRAFNCYSGDEIKLKLPGQMRARVCIRADTAPYIPYTNMSMRILQEEFRCHKLFLTPYDSGLICAKSTSSLTAFVRRTGNIGKFSFAYDVSIYPRCPSRYHE